jgi:hypothetical protein
VTVAAIATAASVSSAVILSTAANIHLYPPPPLLLFSPPSAPMFLPPAAADVATVACLLRHSYHRCTACRHYTTAVSTTIDAAL